MGVNDTDKYPVIKDLLEIPQDEPIFILRAQDNAAMLSVSEYGFAARQVGASKEFIKEVNDISMDFADWRHNNRDKCKIPDSD